MKIDAARDGGATILRLGGRLDREWAGHLSTTLDELLREGVRSLVVDLSAVTYVSSAAVEVLARGQQELAALRGEVRLTEIPGGVRELFTVAGWDPQLQAFAGGAAGGHDLRQSSWQLPALAVRSGEYQTTAARQDGTLRCRLHGHPERLVRGGLAPDDCHVVRLTPGLFALGVGAIGGGFADCRERLGELAGVAGCAAYFPSDGARMADYLIGDGGASPRVLLASGLSCEGSFSRLVRFTPHTEAESVPLSELAGVCLDAAGGKQAGLVVAAETDGLAGVRLRRSPAAADTPLSFEVPAVREWLSFSPERTHPRTIALIVGVVARGPQAGLAAHLRPLAAAGRLVGHLHALVFSYRPLPQRTVELEPFVKELFRNQELLDVLHLLWDDRGQAGVGESTLLRGVGWVGPITQVA